MKILFATVSAEFRLTQDAEREPRPLDLISYGKNFNGESPKEEDGLHTGRLGGDEFGSICYTDTDGAEVIAARIRKLVHEYVYSEGKEHLRELGLSAAIGIATLEDGMTSSDLLKLADGRMYEDKRAQKEARKTRLTPEQQALITQLEDTGVNLKEIEKYRQHAAPGSEQPSLF
jgi:predicted signal transduction protein with EAL and GGDEF domain